MFVGSGRVVCWGRRSWSNDCLGPKSGLDMACMLVMHCHLCRMRAPQPGLRNVFMKSGAPRKLQLGAICSITSPEWHMHVFGRQKLFIFAVHIRYLRTVVAHCTLPAAEIKHTGSVRWRCAWQAHACLSRHPCRFYMSYIHPQNNCSHSSHPFTPSHPPSGKQTGGWY